MEDRATQLSSVIQTALRQDQPWETSAPHTLSVVELNQGGHRYWGYYGLQGTECGGVGLAFSDDLVTWTKYPENPLFTNARWPRVAKVGDMLYMVHDKNYCQPHSEIWLERSTDGISWVPVKALVPPNHLRNSRNQNGDLWLNPVDGMYYLYWYSGDDHKLFEIIARRASSPNELDVAASDQTVLISHTVLAAPDMMYHGGSYFLSTEGIGTDGAWNTTVFSSDSSPTSGFKPLRGNPVMAGGRACLFQTVFGDFLDEFYCRFDGNTWSIEHQRVNLDSARPLYRAGNIGDQTWARGYWRLGAPTPESEGAASIGGIAPDTRQNALSGSATVIRDRRAPLDATLIQMAYVGTPASMNARLTENDLAKPEAQPGPALQEQDDAADASVLVLGVAAFVMVLLAIS